MTDELTELRNYFFLGNLSAALTEGNTVGVDDPLLRQERDVILARVNISRGEAAQVRDSVGEDVSTAMQAVRLLATYVASPEQGDVVAAQMQSLLDDEFSRDNATLRLLAALVFIEREDYDAALRSLHGGESLEHYAARVQLLLRMDRPELAERELAAMQNVDADATLTQLASAWVNLAKGGEAAQEALYTFQELLERHGGTELLLNGIALCNIALGRYEEAERTVKEALSKNPKYADSLVHAVVVAKHLQRPAEQVVARYLEHLKLAAPEHAWLRAYEAFDADFDAAIASATAQGRPQRA